MNSGKLGLLALAAALACETAPPQPCGGACGPGTVCSVETSRCVPEAPAAVEAPKPDPKSKRRRHKRRGSAGAQDPGVPDDPAAADEPAEALPPFVAVDDSKIPEFSAEHTQALDLDGGNERLSESVLDKHFARVTPRIQECVVTASRHGEVGSGRLAVKLRILPSGRVESVSVKAPASLRVWGIVPCARKAVYDHRFPAFDGPSIGVDFGVDVD